MKYFLIVYLLFVPLVIAGAAMFMDRTVGTGETISESIDYEEVCDQWCWPVSYKLYGTFCKCSYDQGMGTDLSKERTK